MIASGHAALSQKLKRQDAWDIALRGLVGKAVRNALYMAALSAICANPDIAVFYRRLGAAGKKFKVAITAVIRKLAILENTLITQSRAWAQICP